MPTIPGVRDRRARVLGGLLLLATGLAGCSVDTRVDGSASPAPTSAGPGGQAELVRGGACAEVFAWAASESGEVVVTVRVDLYDRPAGAPTDYEFELPDAEATVMVLTGTGDLTENLCTDLLTGPDPTGEQEAVAGTVRLVVGPPGQGCGDAAARLRIDGLVAADGTTFAPVDLRVSGVGCSVGG